jgi:hypothetical protein
VSVPERRTWFDDWLDFMFAPSTPTMTFIIAATLASLALIVAVLAIIPVVLVAVVWWLWRYMRGSR